MKNTASTLEAGLARCSTLGALRTCRAVELRRFTAYLGVPAIRAKPEDAMAFGFGGNKLGKLDYVSDEAIEAKADTLVRVASSSPTVSVRWAAAAANWGWNAIRPFIMADWLHRDRVQTPVTRCSTGCLVRISTMSLGWVIAMSHQGPGRSSSRAGAGHISYLRGVSNPLGAVGYASAIMEIAEKSR